MENASYYCIELFYYFVIIIMLCIIVIIIIYLLVVPSSLYNTERGREAYFYIGEAYFDGERELLLHEAFSSVCY